MLNMLLRNEQEEKSCETELHPCVPQKMHIFMAGQKSFMSYV